MDIDVWVYVHDKNSLANTSYHNPRNIKIQSKPFKLRKDILQYKIFFQKQHAHNCLLFNKARILSIIHKKGPLIGNSETYPQFRGNGLFPFAIRKIAEEMILQKEKEELFILVRIENQKSIRGIEKAGFQKKYYIQAKRWLWFYFKRNIEKF